MILKEGDNILVAHRRLYEKDAARFFVGRVDAYEAGIVKTTGHTYVWDPTRGQVCEKAEQRTKIMSLSSETLIVYQLSESVAVDAVKFVAGDAQLTLTDGKGL